VGHVAHTGKMRNAYKILVGCLKGRDHFEDLDVDGTIILKHRKGIESDDVQ
jgi:hypothetical protein